eukprot:403373531
MQDIDFNFDYERGKISSMSKRYFVKVKYFIPTINFFYYQSVDFSEEGDQKLDDSKDEELKLLRVKEEAEQKKQRDEVFLSLQRELQLQQNQKIKNQHRYLHAIESRQSTIMPIRRVELNKENDDGQFQKKSTVILDAQVVQNIENKANQKKRKSHSKKRESQRSVNKIVDIMTFKSKDKIFGVTSREKMFQILVPPPQSPPVGVYSPNFFVSRLKEQAYLKFDPPQTARQSYAQDQRDLIKGETLIPMNECPKFVQRLKSQENLNRKQGATNSTKLFTNIVSANKMNHAQAYNSNTHGFTAPSMMKNFLNSNKGFHTHRQHLQSQGSSKTLYFALQTERKPPRNIVDGPSESRFVSFDNFPHIYSSNNKQDYCSFLKITIDNQQIQIYKNQVLDRLYLMKSDTHLWLTTIQTMKPLMSPQNNVTNLLYELTIKFIVVPFGKNQIIDNHDTLQQKVLKSNSSQSLSNLLQKMRSNGNINFMDKKESINFLKTQRFMQRAQSSKSKANIERVGQNTQELYTDIQNIGSQSQRYTNNFNPSKNLNKQQSKLDLKSQTEQENEQMIQQLLSKRLTNKQQHSILLSNLSKSLNQKLQNKNNLEQNSNISYNDGQNLQSIEVNLKEKDPTYIKFREIDEKLEQAQSRLKLQEEVLQSINYYTNN